MPARTPPPVAAPRRSAQAATSRRAASERGGRGPILPPGPARLAVAGVVVVVVLVVLITQVFSGGGSGGSPSATPSVVQSPALAGTDTTPSQTPTPSRVAVLNGTTTAGLARKVADQVTRGGYKIGVVTNAPTHAQATTAVYFTSGHRDAAVAVAQTIGAGPDAVQPIDTATAAAAHGAPVVVTVGADRLQQ